MRVGQINRFVLVFLVGIITFLVCDNVYAKQIELPNYTEEQLKAIEKARYCKYNTGLVEDFNNIDTDNLYSNKDVILVLTDTGFKFLNPSTGFFVNSNSAWDKKGINQYVIFDSDNIEAYLIDENLNLTCKNLYFAESGDDLYIYTQTEWENLNLTAYERETWQNGGSKAYNSNVQVNKSNISGKKVICDESKKGTVNSYFNDLYTDTESRYQNKYDLLINTFNLSDAQQIEELLKDANSSIEKIHNTSYENLKLLNASIGCSDTDISDKANQLESLRNNWITKYNNKAKELIDSSKQSGVLSEESALSIIENLQTTLEEVNKEAEQIRQRFNSWTKDEVYYDCEGILDPELVKLINKLLNWVRILVPILLIILGAVDFGKAVLIEDKGDELKKTVSNFTKRCIIAIIIFFVPTIIHILVDIFNNVSNIPLTDLPDCGIK